MMPIYDGRRRRRAAVEIPQVPVKRAYATNRFYAHESIYDAFVEKLALGAAKIKVWQRLPTKASVKGR